MDRIKTHSKLYSHYLVCEGEGKMGKFIGYTIFIITIVFVLEWFQIVDVPYLEIPDYTSGKKAMVESRNDALGQAK